MSDPWQRTPIKTAPLSAVLLARDAGPDLEEVVTAWAAQLDALGQPYEIILVNDTGAADAVGRLDTLAEQLPGLRVCHHPGAGGGPPPPPPRRAPPPATPCSSTPRATGNISPRTLRDCSTPSTAWTW
jgi:hypothetical protein